MKLASLRVLICMTVVLGTGVASAQSYFPYAGAHELSNCNIPTRVHITSGLPWPGYYAIKRYVQYPGGNLTEILPQAGYSTGKNWPMVLNHAPGQIQNCSNGGPGGTQWLTFRLKTTNYFSTDIGKVGMGHLVFGLRYYMPSPTQHDGIGMILMPSQGGMRGERFRSGFGLPDSWTTLSPSQIPLQDGVEYAVVIHATANYASYSLTNVATGQTTGFVGAPFWQNPYYPNYTVPPANGTGLALAVLCSGNSSCEEWNYTPWSVDISSISSGWF